MMSYQDALKLNCALKFKNVAEYHRNRKAYGLPSAPKSTYREFDSWESYLGLSDNFLSYDQARDVARYLKIKNMREYKKRYKELGGLPVEPNQVYKAVWSSWYVYLSKVVLSYDKAKKAAISLGVKSQKEYGARYKEIPGLPRHPKFAFGNDFEDYYVFLGIPKKYSFEETKQIVLARGITNISAYREILSSDPKLLVNPTLCKEYKGVQDFFGTFKCYSYQEAVEVLRSAGIGSWKQYHSLRKSDPRLPAGPAAMYKKSYVGASEFFSCGDLERHERFRKNYYSYEEAKKVVVARGYNSKRDYASRYREDERLPRDPRVTYGMDFEGYREFLGVLGRYTLYNEAKAAAQKLNVKTMPEYGAKFKEDRRLCRFPYKVWAEEWEGWDIFLGMDTKFYGYTDAKIILEKNEIYTLEDYKRYRKVDRRLPSSPEKVYGQLFEGYDKFLPSNGDVRYYGYLAAKSRAGSLRIKSKDEYRAARKNDTSLPVNPESFYGKYFEGYIGYLKGWVPDSYDDCKALVHDANINSVKEYNRVYKLFEGLPLHPERRFQNEWEGWPRYLNLQQNNFYALEELKFIVRKNGIGKIDSYHRMRASDKKMPASPEEHYVEWESWYDLFGKETPLQLKYIPSEYRDWRVAFEVWLRDKSLSNVLPLCKFLRGYIMVHGYASNPEAFILGERPANVNDFKLFLESFSSLSRSRSANVIIRFLDDFIVDKLTIESEETGELVAIEGARNPFMFLTQPEVARQGLDETVKPALPYYLLKAARDFIFPSVARSFKELSHIYEALDSDWVTVDDVLIDVEDPDLVYRDAVSQPGMKQIWVPTLWVMTYLLMSYPLRGVQIAYCDSGEADEFVPEFADGVGIIWVKNLNKLSGLTKNQGVIKRYPDDSIGVYMTTNKSSRNGQGYSVPWLPEEIAYWLIKLRHWQEKYNPLVEVTKWKELLRTNLNEERLSCKGGNCFLFRGFRSVEAVSFQSPLAKRIAFALYNIQSKNLPVAKLESHNKRVLGDYTSAYTPHAMRVSLITALVVDGGLPLEIMMKIVGHAAIVMTIYYCKISPGVLRRRMEVAEKKALQKQVSNIQEMFVEQNFDELAKIVVSNSVSVIESIKRGIPAASVLFRDFGFCPVANSRCHEGGELISGTLKSYSQVQNGYLGSQNCPLCRFFVTGPAFIGGLLALSNEISLAANQQAVHYQKLEEESLRLESKIRAFEARQYDRERASTPADMNVSSGNNIFEDEEFFLEEKLSVEIDYANVSSQLELSATKLNVYLVDLQAVFNYLKKCIDLLSSGPSCDGQTKAILVVGGEFPVTLVPEESRYFHLLNEVCENAEIYRFSNPSNALAPRSQLLDKMIELNGMKPALFKLTEGQQLIAGNQLSKLLLSRLKSWDKVCDLIDGKILIRECPREERISQVEINGLIYSQTKQSKLEP